MIEFKHKVIYKITKGEKIMSFADNIIKVRRENDLTQEQFAEELNVSRQAISKWERGIGYPEVEKILYISNRYGKSLDELFADEIDVSSRESRSEDLKPVEKGILQSLSDYWANLSAKERKAFKVIGIIFIILLLGNVVYNMGYDLGRFLYNILH